MKILKKAEQKNIVLNKDYYNIYQINAMLNLQEIFYFDSNSNICYENVTMFGDVDFRIFTENLKEIKVVLDEYGYYTTVAIGKDDTMYYVNLQ